MKIRNLLKICFILSMAFLAVVACNTADEKDSADKENFMTVGIVKAINKEKSEITIDHEKIEGLMSAMTMDFPVADKKLLEAAEVGDKIEFEIKKKEAEMTVTKIRKIGEVGVNKEVSAAAEIYKTNCAECHGVTGEGVENKGISFLKGHALDHTEEDFIRRVTNGKTDEMPAFEDKLSEEEIKAVVKYVREEIQSKAEPKDKGKGHKH